MLVIFALFATVLLGTMAIATDLSVSTTYKRNLQNTTDSAALAGAAVLPASPTSTDTAAAAQQALAIVHNAYPWRLVGNSNTPAKLVQNAGCGNGTLQCSVTVCAGMSAGCPAGGFTEAPQNPGQPYIVTVNAPPLTAQVTKYNYPNDPTDVDRVEVVMRQQTGGFFNAFIGISNQDAAQSVAYHFAAGQPFPFALYSRTLIQSGNQGETVDGNIYADRYLAPQSNGHAGICAAPDPYGHLGYIFLGYPQQDDGAAYTTAVANGDPGQSTSRGDPIIDNATCPASGGTVAMSANPAAGCNAGIPGNDSGATVSYDQPDGACEADPPIAPPTIAPLPDIPVAGVTPGYSLFGCGGGLVGGVYQAGEYSCATGPAITVSNKMAAGIYEIDHTAAGGCDVILNDGADLTAGVTFYLKGGAVICPDPSSGVYISQVPYFNTDPSLANNPGNGKYAVLSDGSGTPQINTGGHGGGSTSGVWSVTGMIDLPNGIVNISNKNAIEDTGQVVVDTWNDQSGDHLNPSVTYNGVDVPPQDEKLQLNE
jgi:Flp pilus assembly protein TadG